MIGLFQEVIHEIFKFFSNYLVFCPVPLLCFTFHKTLHVTIKIIYFLSLFFLVFSLHPSSLYFTPSTPVYRRPRLPPPPPPQFLPHGPIAPLWLNMGGLFICRF